MWMTVKGKPACVDLNGIENLKVFGVLDPVGFPFADVHTQCMDLGSKGSKLLDFGSAVSGTTSLLFQWLETPLCELCLKGNRTCP